MEVGKTQPALRSDLAKLRKERDEKKREEQAAKKKAAEPKPNIGTEGKKKPEQGAPFMEGMKRKGPEDLRKDLKSSAKDAESRGDVRRTASETVGAATDFGSKLMTSMKEIGKAAVTPDEKVDTGIGSQGLPNKRFESGYMSDVNQDTMTGIGDIGEYYYKRYKDPVRRGIGAVGDFIRGAQNKAREGIQGASNLSEYMASSPFESANRETKRRLAVEDERDRELHASQRSVERSQDLKAELEEASNPAMRTAYDLHLDSLKKQYPNKPKMWDFEPGSEDYKIGLQEFAQDMTGISPKDKVNSFATEEKREYERHNAGITGEQALQNLTGKVPMSMPGAVKIPNAQRDSTNAERIRTIKGQRVAAGKDELDDGMKQYSSETGVDLQTGLPVIKGDVMVGDGAGGFTRNRRAPTDDLMDVVNQLPPGEKELYFAQQMGLNLEAIPENQRIAAARKFYAAKSPEAMGENFEAVPDLDALGYDDDGNIIQRSAPMVYKRSEKGRQQLEDRKNYQDLLRRTRSHNASADFQNNDGGVFTNKYRLEDGSFDVERFNAENPGVLPVDEEGNINPDDPMTRRVQDAIDRGTAVKQQTINRGYMQNLQSPTLRPMMMKQSLDQTDDLREKAEIAYAHGDPTLAEMYLQMDADDTGLLMEEQKAKAARENKEFDPEVPGAVAGLQIKQIQSGQQNTTGLATELAATGNMTQEQATDYAAKQGVRALKDRMPTKMILLDPQVMSSLERMLEGRYGLSDEVPDAMRGKSWYNTHEEILVIRDKFIRDAMMTYGFAANAKSEAALGEYFDVFQKERYNYANFKVLPTYSNRNDPTEGSAVDQPPAGENA